MRQMRAVGLPISAIGGSGAIILAALVSAAVIFGLLYDVFDRALRRWTDHDLERHARLIGVAIAGGSPAAATIGDRVRSFAPKAEVLGLLACSAEDGVIARNGSIPFGCRSTVAASALAAHGKVVRMALTNRDVGVSAHAMGEAANLFVVQDRTFLERRRKDVLLALSVGAEGMALLLFLLTHAGAKIGSRNTADAVRSILRRMRLGDGKSETAPVHVRLLARDIEDTLRHVRHTRVSGAERLRAFVNREIGDGRLVVIANREPYAHEFADDGSVVVQRPASGLVTGIEPVLRACGGTWVAYGGGTADRTSADRKGRLAVPPDAPEYTLRRVWIANDEYERYYSGFANEGLWPLCHVAHTKPAFRSADWASYQSVNETFARAAIEEVPPDGLLLIQDYHFALVPRFVREQAPQVVTSLFWHIPWPNAEVAGICPWNAALLEGMLGADVVGFHTRQFCFNFLETAQRTLECRVDFHDMSIAYDGHRTVVRDDPISVEWPYPAATRVQATDLRRSLGIAKDVHVSIGVDRIDYTKGLLERIDAVEALLEENPSLNGRYVLVQLAAPSRTNIRSYQRLAEDLNEAVERVNRRFGNETWVPIVFQMRTFTPQEVKIYYAMANSALVTPLHDGMNLVAKEYVASCENGDGALVLSVFAGASKELQAALLVNPYDARQVAQAILRAIRMPAAERRARMESMRQQIAAHSIYDWSETILKNMADVQRSGRKFWPSQRATPAAALQREIAG